MGEAAGRAVDEAPGWVSMIGRPEVWLVGLAVAAFLALFWMIRGVPLGQATRERAGPEGPGQGRLDRLVAFASAGLVLVAAGAVVAFRSIPWSLPVFVVGFGMLHWAQRGARPFRHDSAIARRVLRFAETATTGSLLAGILAVANVAAFRYGERPIDLTRERVHTLEPETVAQVKGLERPLRLTGFYHGRIADSAKRVERVRQLLSVLESANPDKVSFTFVDFQGDPVRAEELRARVPAAEAALGGVLIELGEGEATDRMVVRDSEMFGGNPEGLNPEGTPETVAFRGEYAIATALARLVLGDRPKAAFTTRHGESPPSELDVRRRGAGLLGARLADVGFDVSTIDLEQEDVPRDVDVVLVDGPTSPFSRAEADRLSAFLDGGGRAILLLDGREPTGLDDLLRGVNLRLEKAVLVEPGGPLGAPSLSVTVRIPDNAAFPILRPLAGQTVTVPAGSPITILNAASSKGEAINPNVAVIPLLRTGPAAWGETQPEAATVAFDPKTDVPGPVLVAAAVAEAVRPNGPPDPERPKLVLIASPNLADNYFGRILGYETNLDLVVNAANWLRGRLDLPEIAPRTRRVARLNPDPTVQIRLIVLPTLVSVSILLGFGTAVYLARRA